MLTNFISEDRYDSNSQAKFPFSTPIREYAEYSGIRLPSFAEAVWHYPEGPFVYGEFFLKEIRYNITSL